MGLLYEVSRLTSAGIKAQFYFSEEKSDILTPTKLDHALIMPPSICKCLMVGSCNGLVFYASYYNTTTNQCETEAKFFVCNPLTGEHIQLPGIQWLWKTSTIGFGHVRSSNEYKVVSVQYENKVGKVQVYNLRGGGGWRDKSSNMIKEEGFRVLPRTAVFAGGALYWMDVDSFKPNPVAFDLEHETFELLPSVPSDFCVANAANHVGLMELGGSFCVLHAVPGRHIIVWELLRQRKIVKDGPCWHLKFTMAWEDYSWFEPLFVPNSFKHVLWCNVILCCYDPETRTLTKLDETLKKLNDEKVYATSRVTPHVNTLVPLKKNERLQRKQKRNN